ncbi:hypothetical protein RI129_004173 [Pyrocoelia pectoralis]|uniref:Nucleoporin NUP35 n=1 Tax=Pyrocoelia pectoralis TaxID=417401 RepID=A0AAN7VKY2_9COLE
MEPMTLGSAPSSPSSPLANPNYLPAFLMGNAKPASPNSPEIRKNISFNLTPSDRSSLRQKLFSPSVPDVPKATLQSPVEINNTPGPPKQSLFDTLDVRRSVNTNTFTPNTPSSFQHDSFSQNVNESSMERVETIRQAMSSNLWVTVFGFPSTASGIVVAQFSSCGLIADKRFPAQGNWVHLKFSNTLEVSKALSLNGKLISNTMMVGVSPYHGNCNKENIESPLPKTPTTRARSLRLSFVSPQNSNMVITPENIPQKSSGILTKAMDYVLGW